MMYSDLMLPLTAIFHHFCIQNRFLNALILMFSEQAFHQFQKPNPTQPNVCVPTVMGDKLN